jgi:hypothetical protein
MELLVLILVIAAGFGIFCGLASRDDSVEWLVWLMVVAVCVITAGRLILGDL